MIQESHDWEYTLQKTLIKKYTCYTHAVLKWITKKDVLCSTRNLQCGMLSVTGLAGGESGGEWTQACVWLSPFTAHLKPPPHRMLIGYSPI